MTTEYFTFGQSHYHELVGEVFDKDCVVAITSMDPRQTMFDLFGNKWAMNYSKLPDMKHYPRGIIEINL